MTPPQEQAGNHAHNHSHDYSRRAPDLDASEASVAAWFSALDRPEAPAALRAAVLASVPGADSGGVPARRPVGRLVRMFSPSVFSPARFPLGGWGLATAALLLVAFGAVAWVEATDTMPGVPGQDGPSATQPVDSLVIVEDPTMPLFHDLETFDEVGLAPDELIADWSR